MKWVIINRTNDRVLATYNNRLTAMAVAEMYRDNGIDAYVANTQEDM